MKTRLKTRQNNCFVAWDCQGGNSLNFQLRFNAFWVLSYLNQSVKEMVGPAFVFNELQWGTMFQRRTKPRVCDRAGVQGCD